MDHSLGGRIMRHHVFLSSNPENWLQYGLYLSTGRLPEAKGLPLGKDYRLHDLHRLTLRVKAHPEEQYDELRRLLPKLLADPDPEVVYYGVILTGLLKVAQLAPPMKAILANKQTPVYLRKDIYQALGNLEDGRQVDFLRGARRLDRPCDEEIRDVVRALKRKRIAPIR
jgi:hypothetical protein